MWRCRRRGRVWHEVVTMIDEQQLFPGLSANLVSNSINKFCSCIRLYIISISPKMNGLPLLFQEENLHSSCHVYQVQRHPPSRSLLCHRILLISIRKGAPKKTVFFGACRLDQIGIRSKADRLGSVPNLTHLPWDRENLAFVRLDHLRVMHEVLFSGGGGFE